MIILKFWLITVNLTAFQLFYGKMPQANKKENNRNIYDHTLKETFLTGSTARKQGKAGSTKAEIFLYKRCQARFAQTTAGSARSVRICRAAATGGIHTDDMSG